jgi:hypothetical protein
MWKHRPDPEDLRQLTRRITTLTKFDIDSSVEVDVNYETPYLMPLFK